MAAPGRAHGPFGAGGRSGRCRWGGGLRLGWSRLGLEPSGAGGPDRVVRSGGVTGSDGTGVTWLLGGGLVDVVLASRPRGLAASRPRGLAASRPRGLAASRPRGLAASRPRGLAASRPRGLAASRPRGRVRGGERLWGVGASPARWLPGRGGLARPVGWGGLAWARRSAAGWVCVGSVARGVHGGLCGGLRRLRWGFSGAPRPRGLRAAVGPGWLVLALRRVLSLLTASGGGDRRGVLRGAAVWIWGDGGGFGGRVGPWVGWGRGTLGDYLW
ncbi:hypothetical protein HNR67_005026 [Crossiella cryophila]|uniref:Uncharacterized protein n=1 Tax=Crossiella cryophila TaxID=43355 RepID=A0A7W7FVV3_9PSEU|nr:hypothetical protein [Crossiella cryophila]